MQSSLSLLKLGLLSLTLFAGSVHGMGQRAKVFETTTDAGIWDSESEFYLRLDLSEISGLTNKKFIWAGFHETTPGLFQGELVLDDFSAEERRFQAQAKLVHSSGSSRYFLVEIFDSNSKVIKEFFIKGPIAP